MWVREVEGVTIPVHCTLYSKYVQVNKYTMWVREVEGVTIPVHYEMRGYNSLLGSHYDHYFLTYDNFSEEVSILFILFINTSF